MTRGSRSKISSGRTRTVWASFALAMSVVGGLLGLLASGPSNGLTGITLPPMAHVTGSSSLEAIYRTKQPLNAAQWDSIVIHDSASPFGTPASIEAEHKRAGLSGLGYDFLIGNGSGMGDGDIYVGYRWLEQLPGAHAVGKDADQYNRHGIGICLIGDGNRRPFSDLQVQRLAELCASLAREFDIPADRVLLQSDLANTASPGRYFPEQAFREYLAGLL